MPAAMAACWPKLRVKRIPMIRWSVCASAVMLPQASFRLPSSIKIISKSSVIGASAVLSCRTNSNKVPASSLYTGATTEMCGIVQSCPAGAWTMIPDKNHIGWTLATGAFVIASGLGLTATFAIWTATSWLEFPQFVIAVAFLFVIPGNQIIRWCRLHLSPLEHITLSAVLGMITTCWLYAGLAWLDIASLLYLWIVVAAAGLGSMWWSLFKNVQGKLLAIDRTHFLLLVAF